MDDPKVAILIEDLMSQFGAFGDGLQLLNEKVEQGFQEVREEIHAVKTELSEFKYEAREGMKQNNLEHQQIKQMIAELANEQQEIKLKQVK